jgi:hypothetical protein
MLCQFHTIISAQIQTQEYTNYQSINGRVYATAFVKLLGSQIASIAVITYNKREFPTNKYCHAIIQNIYY